MRPLVLAVSLLFSSFACANSIQFLAQHPRGHGYANVRLDGNPVLRPTKFEFFPTLGRVPVLRLGFMGPSTVSGSTFATMIGSFAFASTSNRLINLQHSRCQRCALQYTTVEM
jgi:hypothetical protein